MQFHFEWKNSQQEEILYLFASFILSYLITKYAMKQGFHKRFWPLFIFFSLFFYLFFHLLSTSSFSFFQENFTNGLDDMDPFEVSNEISGEISGETPPPTPTPTPEPVPSEISGGTEPSTGGGDSGDQKEPQPSESSGSSSTSEISGESPNINSIIFDRATTGNAYGPLNINVSYKTIGCDGEGGGGRCHIKNPYMDDIDDLGRYNYKSRVHNNKGWMDTWQQTNYGNQAWTLDPDYYIPGANEPKNPPPPPPPVPRPQFQNEINYSYNARKEKCPVCPLEINQPWSEYQSGDKEPEGFNL